ncbi:uncharacterized protein LOC113333380 [Papaver somniferum]|uniref:uncharacterized protein LOC113333380 n=1 Tax=Papaver somniferum TaxID=3469 RepID=UPI000E6F81A6|nr:uncharacterized protein LOC113333380 [Papaver somniferum]XP_026435678.1 uncharacterized protein LOC113333380 [Papaver somniferum]
MKDAIESNKDDEKSDMDVEDGASAKKSSKKKKSKGDVEPMEEDKSAAKVTNEDASEEDMGTEKKKKKKEKRKSQENGENVIESEQNGTTYSHHPLDAASGLDQKLIMWDLERSTARCSCDHEVSENFIKVDCLFVVPVSLELELTLNTQVKCMCNSRLH